MSARRVAPRLGLAAMLTLLAMVAATSGWAAAADSLSHRHVRSGGEALTIGLAATVAPAVLAVLLNPPGSRSDFAWEASLAVGSGVGAMVGPAIGLASGGRGDLAKRGLIVRGVGTAAVLAGLIAIGKAMSEEDGGLGTAAVAALGAVGAAVVTVSSLHDLVITPSATEDRRMSRWQAGVDERGRVAMTLHF